MTGAIASTIVWATTAFAQPAFEAASVKPSQVKVDSSSWNSHPGYLVMRNQTLAHCIGIAYGVKYDQVTGGPKWLDSDRFDIEAKAAGPAGDPELLAMLQSLLAERFQLRLHRDTKTVSGFALVVGKGGLKIRPAEPGPAHRMNTSRGHMTAERATIAKLAEMLTRQLAAPDPEVLALAAGQNRILVTHDRQTMPYHFGKFLMSGQSCPGVFVVGQFAPIGELIDELVLIWAASDAEEWQDRIVNIPQR